MPTAVHAPPHASLTADAAIAARILTTDAVTADLHQLGATDTQVAATLWPDWRGTPECETTCPVALWLTDRYPGHLVEIIEEYGWLWAEVTAPDGTRVVVRLPNPVTAFVVNFDAGNHPELDVRNDPAAAA